MAALTLCHVRAVAIRRSFSSDAFVCSFLPSLTRFDTDIDTEIHIHDRISIYIGTPPYQHPVNTNISSILRSQSPLVAPAKKTLSHFLILRTPLTRPQLYDQKLFVPTRFHCSLHHFQN